MKKPRNEEAPLRHTEGGEMFLLVGAHGHGLNPNLRLIRTSVVLTVRGRYREVGSSAESVGELSPPQRIRQSGVVASEFRGPNMVCYSKNKSPSISPSYRNLGRWA